MTGGGGRRGIGMTGGEKLKERGIGFLPFWVYSEVGERERERERENTHKGFSFLVLLLTKED